MSPLALPVRVLVPEHAQAQIFFSLLFHPYLRILSVMRFSNRKEREIFRLLLGSRGLTKDELIQHTIFFSKTPVERCRISLQSARLSNSFKPLKQMESKSS